MSYRARAYPYPVLSSFSKDFGPDAGFNAQMDMQVATDDSQRISLRYDVTHSSRWMDEYMIDGGAKLVLDVECRATLLREYVDLSGLTGSIDFAPGQLYGVVTATPLIVATRDDAEYQPAGVDPEFGTAKFRVMTGDILGVGESTTFDLEFARTLERDLITIEWSPDPAMRDVYLFVLSGPRIIIKAGENLQDVIGLMRRDSGARPYLYMSIYKDCIAAALKHLADQEEGEEADQPWARALVRKLDELHPPRSLQRDDDEYQEISAQLLVASRGIKKVEAGVA